MFDVPAVLLQNAFNTIIPFTDASRLRDFPPRLTAYQRLLLFKQTVNDLYLSVCCYAIDFI